MPSATTVCALFANYRREVVFHTASSWEALTT
eukprot:COSAG05_NODE_18632_length_305_cov_0.757282_1_plen_31_part_10